MEAKCESCPFQEDTGSRGNWKEVREMVTKRCLTEKSQLCHKPQIKGKKPTHLCRGARDLQLRFMHQLGVIKAPTDEAWAEAWNELQTKKKASKV